MNRDRLTNLNQLEIIQFQYGVGEKASAGKNLVFKVRKPGLIECLEPGFSGWNAQAGRDDGGLKHFCGPCDRGKLKLEFGWEVSANAALTHGCVFGKRTDAQTVQAVDAGELHRPLEDEFFAGAQAWHVLMLKYDRVFYNSELSSHL